MNVEELLDFGVVIIDKPKGPTSHQVSAWVRDILHIKKTGHAGTLDPNVTGVLPVALNRATKIINLLHLQPKEYIGVMRLHGDISHDKIDKVFEEFRGEIYQTPPLRSSVARKLRKRKIYELKLIEIDKRLVLFRTKVESGTYIRSLCRDIGDALCVGAQMEDLRRTSTGQFTEKDAVSLVDLQDAYIFWKENEDNSLLKKYIKPGDVILSFLPKITVKNTAFKNLSKGAPLYKPGLKNMPELSKGELCTVYTENGKFVSLSRVVLEGDIIAKPVHIIV